MYGIALSLFRFLCWHLIFPLNGEGEVFSRITFPVISQYIIFLFFLTRVACVHLDSMGIMIQQYTLLDSCAMRYCYLHV